MPLTESIPDKAEVVANYIRKEVPTPPEGLPNSRSGFTSLGWWGRCPLGLLPNVSVHRPGGIFEILACPVFCDGVEAFSEDAMHRFYDWWDEQWDAEAAVNAVWGAHGSQV